MLKKLILTAVFSLFFTPAFAAYDQAAQLIGVTDAVRALGFNGDYILFGEVDTGVQSNWKGFTGRIDITDSGCTISGCAKARGATDDNGHGTFVASEMIGSSGDYQGIAPHGQLVSYKALGANGSGYLSDVAAGLNALVSHNARIMNLSLSFTPTSDMLGAINYAASKGDLVVFAGGNDGTAFLSNQRISGLTDKAIQSLLLVGSVDASKYISSFSNKPGTGGFVSTSGKFYAFSSLWVMANGEGVYGASLYNGPTGLNYITTMSGTSMAAPQVAGVAGLLAARWPFLLNTNLLAQLVIQSSKDIGVAGVDAVYGNGLVQADRAFQPIGTLLIPINGYRTPLADAQLMVNNTVNGKAIAATLANGVAYDNFGRDFKASLYMNITPAPKNSAAVGLYALTSGSASSRSFTDLGDESWVSTSFADRGASSIQSQEHLGHSGFMQDPSRIMASDWSAGFYSKGTYLGGGYGSGVDYSFNDARWGEKTAFFDSDLSGAAQLLSLAEGSSFAAAGFDLNKHERLSFGVIMGKNDEKSQLLGNEVSAQGLTVGYTWKPEKDWALSFTGSFLKEKNALLGSASSGYLKFGENTRSMAFGMSGNFNLGDGFQLGFDAAVASTDPTNNADSLIDHTSRLTSAGFGVTMRKENLIGIGDHLVATVKAPMHVFGGSANMTIPVGTDENGNPTFERAKTSLAPDGLETDFTLGYTAPVAEKTVASLAFQLRNDADNIRGQVDHAVLFRITKDF